MSATPDPGLLELATALDEIATWIRRHGPPSELSTTARTTLARLAEQGPTRIGDLATQEGVTQPAMTGLVNRLAALGHVAREDDPADARASRVVLTAAGRELVARRQQQRAEVLAVQLARLEPGDREAVLAALPALRSLTRQTTA
ncbi:MarR family winged helix-turn-helix transcriptional regulator [Desertihabitans aurantiacus]|uniref:MarR family winged helix-turn-helix transcriptional regulator n=1 Tax=Desertihabitans aurantiacus TaxID=2282477 RepID=UPI000DF86ADB|nr:MarR family transcriptional regulator [Desertihabitans aurantiacus]